MLGKRLRPLSDAAPACDNGQEARTKRRRASTADNGCHDLDLLARLSDELVLRVLSFLDEGGLLEVSPVSRRLHRIASDSQLWKAHFYSRFIKPRTHGTHRTAGRASAKTWWRLTPDGVDWKRQYRLRHNWQRGACAVQEMRVHEAGAAWEQPQTLVKVVQGMAVTADAQAGLRAWDLRSRRLVAQTGLATAQQPTCVAVDDQHLGAGWLDVATGFADGTFGTWRLHVKLGALDARYTSQKQCEGELAAVAYSHPYVLTATDRGYISLYEFKQDDVAAQTGPRQITELKSHSSRMPLALSIRRTAAAVVASVAYTFDAGGGWAIGIQDLHVTTEGGLAGSRVAFTLPVQTRRQFGSQASSDFCTRAASPLELDGSKRNNGSSSSSSSGPRRLCYRHPYMLVTLSDNTLLLHVCTASATALSIGPGVRLWGHTSGISDAEVTPRGRAVSVSMQGDEIRLWELEGPKGSSVQVRPRQQQQQHQPQQQPQQRKRTRCVGEARRNWVGFDEEMVVVLEKGEGGERLMVYDFA
ncbi:hypothetical protein CDD81_2059 [Ophiocordyceps australis]|uniref:F-box domain-containing protein n=1 Tax=Ophiocordyceps australis TaxID=1399860 RepID=A0A2C5XXQ1_9HYPO|nr:hypothetical protein CDD81_2059 [Ophiocordyceps australis]